MFEKFKSSFAEFTSIDNPLIEMKGIPFKYSELLLEFGGKCFDNGLYSIHTFNDSLKWTDILFAYFKKFKEEMISFGHDWMGRHYCVPTRSNECILVFDPDTPHEDFFIDTDLFSFHNNILAENKIDILESNTFRQILNHLNIDNIKFNQCIGFKTPLFLNGKLDMANYQVEDLEVYWEFQYQIYEQIKYLPEGTRISKAAINPFEKK